MMKRLVLALLVTMTLAAVLWAAPWEAVEERPASASPFYPSRAERRSDCLG